MANLSPRETYRNVPKPFKSTYHSKVHKPLPILVTRTHTMPLQSSETWTTTESSSISTHFTPVNAKQTNFRKCPTKPLPLLSLKSHPNVTNHRKLSPVPLLSPSTSSCEIEAHLCFASVHSCATDVPASSTTPQHKKHSISQSKKRYKKSKQKKEKAKLANHEARFVFPSDSYQSATTPQSTNEFESFGGAQSGFSGVTADELLQLISCGQCSSDCDSDDTQQPVPSPNEFVCIDDTSGECTTTTVIPSILSMSPQIDVNGTPPTFSLSPRALQHGDTLIYDMISYSITDENTDEDSQDESHKISQTLSALHHDINSVTLSDIKH